jgi:ectoine hydroxylase-related dioxygenase (phytanoyl-CoA dioxygenase family)
VIGESIGWIALSGYRTTAPASRETEDPFEGRHQDGFMNGSIPFRTCWIPLHEINAETGGLALAEGLHHSRYLHDALDPPRFRIPRGSIPDDAWRSSDYAPGDVIMFDIGIPHAGLPNRSRRFRLSLDARLIPASHPERPLEGAIVSLERNRVVVRDERGCIREAAIDETTYFRGHSGARLPFEALAPLLPSGMKAMVGVRHGVATILRPAR